MSGPEPAVQTEGLGKRYGGTWALRGCTVTVPRGRVSALVGPNGAGKTTLLRLVAGLASPTEGSVAVLGRRPEQSADFLGLIGYLAQQAPLYRQLNARDHIHLGAHLNRRWNGAAALERLQALRVPLDRPVRTLSGGQRAQVALAFALAKQPAVLILDEPVAALDPLARHEFLASLAAAVALAEGQVTVVLSSHLVHDLERVCDHVVILNHGRARLCADIDLALAQHRALVGPRQAAPPPGATVVRAVRTSRQSRLVARLEGPLTGASWESEPLGLEDIVLAYMAEDEGVTAGPLSLLEVAT